MVTCKTLKTASQFSVSLCERGADAGRDGRIRRVTGATLGLWVKHWRGGHSTGHCTAPTQGVDTLVGCYRGDFFGYGSLCLSPLQYLCFLMKQRYSNFWSGARLSFFACRLSSTRRKPTRRLRPRKNRSTFADAPPVRLHPSTDVSTSRTAS